MLKSFRVMAVSLVALGLAISLVAASGGSSGTPSSTTTTPETEEKTPLEQAEDHYNTGLMIRDKAWKLEKKAEGAGNDAQREKLLKKVEQSFKRARKEFEAATQKHPEFHEAFSSLGYASRRLGDYEAAIEAYDRALGLAPSYAEAIEYRAEAYLGLNRIEDAKQAYMKLFGMDRERADELMAAMQKWVERRRQDPGDVSSDAIEDFAGWVSERASLAGQTSTVAQQQQRDW